MKGMMDLREYEKHRQNMRSETGDNCEVRKSGRARSCAASSREVQGR